LIRGTLLVVAVATLFFACIPSIQSLTPARFEIAGLWITPYGYDPGSVKVTKIFTDQQYWFGATIRKYGEESAKATYRWTFDNLGSVEDHESVQSGEVLEYPIAAQFGGAAVTIGYQIVFFWPGAPHTFGFTIEWESASGGAGTVSSSMSFEVEKPPVTETTTAEQATFTGVSTAFPGTAITGGLTLPPSPETSYGSLLVLLLIGLFLAGVLVVINRQKSRRSVGTEPILDSKPTTSLEVETGALRECKVCHNVNPPYAKRYCVKCGSKLE